MYLSPLLIVFSIHTNIFKEWFALLSPVCYRVQEYINERAYVRKIKRVIRERLVHGRVRRAEEQA